MRVTPNPDNETMINNLTWHSHSVDQQQRAKQKTQHPVVIWFTGLSASGKSTIANALDQVLTRQNYHTYLLDGDNLRHGLCRDLGFSDVDRTENIRRIGEVAKLMTDAGLIVLSAFISPFAADREIARNMLPHGEFIEVFVDASLQACQKRDPKGLYEKALQGEIKNFTGIDSPYEEPSNPDIYINTEKLTVPQAAHKIMVYLHDKTVLKAGYQPLAQIA
jgi:adenylylsulfate kinase